MQKRGIKKKIIFVLFYVERTQVPSSVQLLTRQSDKVSNKYEWARLL